MDLAGLKRRVLAATGDDSGVLFTSTHLLDWANDAQKEIARKTRCVQEIFTQSWVVGSGGLTLDTDFIDIHRVTFDDRKINKATLQAVELMDEDRDYHNVVGPPEFFYIWSEKLFLYPNPDYVGEISIWANVFPAEIAAWNEATDLTLPLPYHEDVVNFVIMRAKERDEDWPTRDRYRQEFEERVAQSSSDEESSADSYSAVRPIEGDEW